MRPPALHFRGETVPAEQVTAQAAGWLAQCAEQGQGQPQGLVLANHPEPVALLFALLARPDPVLPLPPDPREWPALAAACPGLRLNLTPAQAGLAGAARAADLPVVQLSAPGADSGSDLCWRSPALLSFTSGSTGARRPVARDPRALLASSAAIAAHLRLAAGAGVLGVLPLCGPHGLVNSLLLATVLESELGLLETFEPRSVLSLFASGRFEFWAGTPTMADLLARTPLPGSAPPSPRVVKLSGGRLPEGVFRAYRDRFGVPPRPAFGTTEHGVLTADGSAPHQVRPDAVGQPLAGVELAIGGPSSALVPGAVGPVWARSPWPMLGFGWPPRAEPGDGWRPTGDLGSLDEAGTLNLAGRTDDCFKTPCGHLIQPAAVARAVTAWPGVIDAVVLPLPAAIGAAIGAVVEGPAEELELRRHLARSLPAWSQPQVVVVVAALPRLPDGKPDRRGCLKLLQEAR